jgi:dihydrofolate synthase/folylpolyglutamate synthase
MRMGRYQDALEYIFSYVSHEKHVRFGAEAASLSLARMHDLLNRVGRPQDRFRCVHIAGTKGKGSTSAMIESVLRAAGYRTGLYTSPHLHTFRERIRLNGALMAKAELVELLAELRPAFEATRGINTFEIMTALAFASFARQGVEWAVLETGLGGRLDPTNVVSPAVCGITSISYDHVELLGPTLALIAAEKAGIIKPGVPLVSAPQAPEAQAVIEQACADRGASLTLIGRDWTATGQAATTTGQTLTLRRADGYALPDLQIRLTGEHQLDNTAVAVAMLTALRDQPALALPSGRGGAPISDDTLRAGLADARWPGRFETLQHQPHVIVDCAHNGDSALRLRETLAQFFPARAGQRIALVFGASADKDITAMLHTLLPAAPVGGYAPPAKLVLTRSGHPRQADPAQLAALAREIAPACAVSATGSLDAALAEVLAWATPDDVICVTGSVFVVAQARRAWAMRHPNTFSPDDWVYQDETPGQPVPDDVSVSEGSCRT